MTLFPHSCKSSLGLQRNSVCMHHAQNVCLHPHCLICFLLQPPFSYPAFRLFHLAPRQDNCGFRSQRPRLCQNIFPAFSSVDSTRLPLTLFLTQLPIPNYNSISMQLANLAADEAAGNMLRAGISLKQGNMPGMSKWERYLLHLKCTPSCCTAMVSLFWSPKCCPCYSSPNKYRNDVKKALA